MRSFATRDENERNGTEVLPLYSTTGICLQIDKRKWASPDTMNWGAESLTPIQTGASPIRRICAPRPAPELEL